MYVLTHSGARWVVSGSYDESVRVWDVVSGACCAHLTGHSRWVRCCRWSQVDGGKRWIISGSRDKTLRLWELAWNDSALASSTPLDSPLRVQINLFKTQTHSATRSAAPQRVASPPPTPPPPPLRSISRPSSHDTDEDELQKLKDALAAAWEEVEELRTEAMQARAESDGIHKKLAIESQEIEQIKDEMTEAIAKARSEADAQKANLLYESEEVDKIKRRFEALEMEIEGRYEATTIDCETMRRVAAEECAHTRREAEVDAQALLQKSFAEMQSLAANHATVEAERRATADAARGLRDTVAKQEAEHKQSGVLMVRWLEDTDAHVTRVEHDLAAIMRLCAIGLRRRASVGEGGEGGGFSSASRAVCGDVMDCATSLNSLDTSRRSEDGVSKYLSSIQV